MPRELHVWLQSLNLTYKITNPKWDLSNGFVFAEIFNWYFPSDIEMYQIDNGFKASIKENNWDYMQWLFKRKGIPIDWNDYEEVIHMAPDAAYRLLKKVYSILTGKEVHDTIQEPPEEVPFYAKPTIAQKVKDHEIDRIVDRNRKTFHAQALITQHNEMLRSDRMNPDRYTKTNFRKQHQEQASAKALSQVKKAKLEKSSRYMNEEEVNEQLATGDVKEVQVKTANKRVRQMRQKAAESRDPMSWPPPELDDSDEWRVEVTLEDVISTKLADKMPKGDPEFKVFKENYERVVEYYLERYQHIPDDLHHLIFSEIHDRIPEIMTILTKTLSEFCDLSQFFSRSIRKMNPLLTIPDVETSKDGNIFLLAVETIAQIGNWMLNTDPQQTEAFFLEYAIDDLIEIVEDNVFKRNEMMYLFYCFVSNTVNSHLRVLMRLKDKIQSWDVFYYCLSKLLIFESDAQDLAPELYTFYFENSAYGLFSSSPVTRTKCVTILSYLSKASIEPIIPLLPRLETYSKDVYWELKGQVLILCANALMAFNTEEEEEAPDAQATPKSGSIQNIHESI